jgi:DNA mismatch repair protein MutS2
MAADSAHPPLASELEAQAMVALDWPLLLDALAERARSAPGQARLRELKPAATPAEARARMATVRAVLALGERGVELPLGDFPDVTATLSRVGLGASASGPELTAVQRVLERARALRAVLVEHGESAPELAPLLGSDPRLDRLAERLDACLERDGTVADAASPALRDARLKAREVREELKRRLSELVQRYADVIQGQYYTERDGRYVLPIRSDAHYRVEGIVLGSSGSGSTLFVEPREVTDLGNKLRVREAAVEREVARVLSELSAALGERVEAARCALEVCVQADVIAALAQWAVDSHSRPIDVADDDRFDLQNARHPLLVLSPGPVVANDIVLAGGQALVVSGPNAGGKTVTLKCLGLFAWMARAGIPLPTGSESHIGWFDYVLADVGDEQSLVRSLSTFSAHVENLAHILAHAAPRVLVLLDEVAAGTDPEEGAALAAAVLEALTTRAAAVAVTTHYERLKELAAQPGPLGNASVGFDFASMSPTFRLTLGVPGASSALAVAARHGLSAELLARAEALLPHAAVDRERVIQELSRERERLSEARAALESERRAQTEREIELEAERERLHDAARTMIEKEARELLSQVKSARLELSAARARLKLERFSEVDLKSVERVVNHVAREVALGGRLAPAPSKPRAPQPRLDANLLKPGTRVRLLKTGNVGTVLESPERGAVHLRVGAVRIREQLDELELAPPAPKTPKEPRRLAISAKSALPAAQRTQDNTLDLRGVRVEDAVDRVDAFLDRMLGEGEPVGFVLHGHGTGALRQRVREHLATCNYVEHSRAAEPDEGGDAFTVFWVR